MKALIALLALAVMLGASDCRAESVVPQSREQITLTFAPLVKQVTPAVVNIYTQKLVRQRVSPLFDDPFFRQFFGDAAPQGMTRQRMQNSLGSGVIVRADGLIVTSNHVIEGADEIRVVLSDKREFDAKTVMSDAKTDLAVLRIDAKGASLPHLELRDSDGIQVGDLVLAIGNPFGVGQTVTSGIVSALSHKAVGAGDYDYFIQTDAAINPGNSGGALVTMDGKLAGINASIYSRSGGNLGIGFAVPSNLVRSMVRAVAQGQKTIVHPWIGAEGQEVTSEIAASLGLTQPVGFLVKNMHAASPLAKAGIKVGDVVTAIDGKDVDDWQAFRYRLATQPIGSQATLTVLRKGQKFEAKIDLIAPPENTPRDEKVIEGRNPLSGAKLANLSPAVAEELGLRDTDGGVVVVTLRQASTAARIGLQPGDLILGLNGVVINSVDQVAALVAKPSPSWKLTVVRDGQEITMMFRGN